MKRDEINELLKEQLKKAEERERKLNARIDALVAEVASLKEALLSKTDSLSKQQRMTKAVAKLLSNESEKQLPESTKVNPEEGQRVQEQKREQIKARKNNGAKRDMHYEMEVEEHEVYPDDPNFDVEKARLFSKEQRICIRYECVPMRFIKHVYKIHTYTQDGKLYEGKTPKSAFLNSNYDGSFIAGLMELRYIQSMPVERIINYFGNHGFILKKPTAHKLIERTSVLLENIYKSIRQNVLQDCYISADETYYKILVPQKNAKGKGVKKGYLWVIVGMKSKLIYLLYEDGSRLEDVILKELGAYSGILQSDAYAPYRKLQSDLFPSIKRIPCLQHIKRKFIDCGGSDKDATQLVSLINKLYQEEHKHKIGEEGWTAEMNLKHRQTYAPKVLNEISQYLRGIESKGNLLPKSDLQGAITYLKNEWEAIENLFAEADTHLDNNLVERFNRYLSISRRNSLFFGSHKGAERGAILYTIALSCKMNGVNMFNYLTDIINRTAEWQPNTPIERYRELLPDKWKNG